MNRGLIPFAILPVILTACVSGLDLMHTETACVHPGEGVSITINTVVGTNLAWKIQDDFGGDVTPPPSKSVVGSNGTAVVTWHVPAAVTATTLHFLLTATRADARTDRDIHVRVKPIGDHC